jgi:hypothetical protein
VKLYYGRVTAVSWSVTNAQDGYPASNVSLESIGRPYKSTGAGAVDLVINFSAAAAVAAILLQDVNFASCTIAKSPDGTAFSSVGTLTTNADKWTGRRRGVLEINDPTVKAIKISIGAGTPTDGTSTWRLGSAYPFGSVVTMPRESDYHARVEALYPKVRTELANQQVAVATTGADLLVLSLPFTRASDQDVLELVRRGRLGTVGVTLSNTNYPELAMPMRYVEESQAETLDFYRYGSLSIELREVT